MDKKDFVHKINLKVRFTEVDMLGFVNNVVYLSYFEHARLEYIKEAGLVPPNGLFTDGTLYFVVHNEISYFDFSKYGDELTIYTRISYVKNSSFGYEHIIVNSNTGKLIVEGSGVLVHVDAATKKSKPLGKSAYEKIKKYDPSAKIIKGKK